MALNHFLYSLSIIMNIVTVSVYWIIIHKENMKELEGQQLPIFQQYIVHVVPAFCCWFNAFISNIVLSRKVLVPLVQFGAFYMFTNFVQTKKSGKPIYSFLPWTDLNSPLLVIVLMIGFSFVYIGLCKFDEYLKWDEFVGRNVIYMKNGGPSTKTQKS